MRRILVLCIACALGLLWWTSRPSGVPWTKHPTPLFGGVGAHASQEPSVLVSGQTLRMWYTYGLYPPVMAYATSMDGVTWTQHGAVLGGGASGYAGRYEHGAVLWDAGWLITYFADENNGTLLRSQSRDGVHWSRPQVVIARQQEPWSLGWNNSAVWHDTQGWHMLAEGNELRGVFLLALAQSPDGLHWHFPTGGFLQSLRPFGSGTTGGPDLIQSGTHDDLYYHASTNGGDLPTDLYQAKSTDLVHWSGIHLIVGRTLPFEVDQVGDPARVRFRDRSYLYYSAVDNARLAWSIAVAMQ